MPHDELIALLSRARTVLDRYLFDPDGDATRDDVAELCMAIDDALPQMRLTSPGALGTLPPDLCPSRHNSLKAKRLSEICGR